MKDTHQGTGTARNGVVRAPHGTGKEPPDVIEVVFPADAAPEVTRSPRAGESTRPSRANRRTGRGARARPAGRPARPSHRSSAPAETRAWPERPLLYGGVAIAAVGLAALLAWVVWPQSPAGPDALRPLPTPSYAPLVLPHTAAPVQKRPSTAAGTPGRTAVTPTGRHSATPPTPVAAPPAGTVRTSATAAPSATAPRTLRPGDAGPDVTQLQHLLFDQGFTYVSLTGEYDAATERGVAQAQQDRGLTCDPRGVYGPCTRAALTS